MLRNRNNGNCVMCNYLSSMPIEEQEWRDVNPVNYTCFSSYIPQTESLLYTVFENTFRTSRSFRIENTSSVVDDQQ